MCVGGVAACGMLCVGGWGGEYVEWGGGRLAQFYLGGNILKKFAIRLLQMFLLMRYYDYLRSKMTCFNSDQDGL